MTTSCRAESSYLEVQATIGHALSRQRCTSCDIRRAKLSSEQQHLLLTGTGFLKGPHRLRQRPCSPRCGHEETNVHTLEIILPVLDAKAGELVPIKEIEPRTGLSRNTIRAWLRKGEMVEPKYPKRVVVSKLDGFTETLASTAANASCVPSRRCTKTGRTRLWRQQCPALARGAASPDRAP